MDILTSFTRTDFEIESTSEEENEENESHNQKRLTFQKDAKKVDLRNTKTFRRVEKDIKDLNKRRRNRQKDGDVCAFYVDKDRAISVTGGAEDLKGDILKHRGTLLKSNRSGELEAAEIQVILEQANREIRLGDPWKALLYLEKSIQIRQDDMECLLLKSQCLVAVNRNTEALSYIEVVIRNGESKHSKAFAVKGDALYNLGRFEYSLLYYHRGIRTAKSKEKLEILRKIDRTEAAVKNALGRSSTPYFTFLSKRIFLDGKVEDESGTRDKPPRDKRFLSELAGDKKYLADFLKKFSRNKRTDLQKSISRQAAEGIQFLRDRREFWEQQKPDYSSFNA